MHFTMISSSVAIRPGCRATRLPHGNLHYKAAVPKGRNYRHVCKFVEGASGPASVVDIVLEEHNQMKSMLKEYKSHVGSDESKQKLAWRFVRELAMHAAKEELVLYNTVKEKLGQPVVDEAMAEHQTLKNTINVLVGLEPTDPQFKPTMEKLFKEFLTHAGHEEKDMLVSFRKAAGVDEPLLKTLAREYQDAAKAAENSITFIPNPDK